ncbi:MAG: hypothetical protein ACRDNZ_24035 [Streptosporangiaceae bacterium]
MSDSVEGSQQAQRGAQIDQAIEHLDRLASLTPAEMARETLEGEFSRLLGLATDLATIITDVFVFPPDEGSGQAQERDELLADVPASCRPAPDPDDIPAGVATLLANAGVAPVVREWLAAARGESRQ